MKGQIEIYKSAGKQTEVKVRFDADTVWLTQAQMAALFETTPQNITMHLKSIYTERELDEKATCKDFLQVRTEGKRTVKRHQQHYNLDAIISVGYRIKSARATQFRIWATQRLKDYLVQGYAINEKRLAEKQQEVQYLKTGIRILGRTIEKQEGTEKAALLQLFSTGLKLLDDYDHKTLDRKGSSIRRVYYPPVDEYMAFIAEMYADFTSGVFARPKDQSFSSSVNQIRQSFDGKDLYPSLEEKAANLLYLIVKNHSFVDGNKRIAAACFLYFIDKNGLLCNAEGVPIISNHTLAALTLFIAVSAPGEKETVIRLIITILNKERS